MYWKQGDQLMISKLTQSVDLSTIQYKMMTSKNFRKKISQFFTPPSIASFMSSLYKPSGDTDTVSVLDAGAGTGILAASICDELLKYDYIKNISVVLYENNDNVLPILKENMDNIVKYMMGRDKNFTYKIINKNFVLENVDFWRNNLLTEETELFDIVIANPPYKKIGKDDIEAQAMGSIVHGQPNIYFLFMALSAKLLKDNGQFIFIVPRSFTTGAYFHKFREWFLCCMQIENLHTFSSRSNVFNGDEILQEAVVLKAIKTTREIPYIKISESEDLSFDDINFSKVSRSIIIDTSDNNHYIRIPTSKGEVELLEHIGKWHNNLITLGFKLKTGPVVDFRATEFLISSNEYDGNTTVPLLWASNLNEMKIKWPVEHEKKPQTIILSEESRSILLPNKDYILVKRFTSKEEAKRIQCAMYFKEDFICELVGVENHLNYITKLTGEMTKQEQFGIFTVLNSSYIDRYYRMLNGNTQVNAGEANSIPMPTYAEIVEIGRIAMENNELTVADCDRIVNEFLNKNRDANSNNRGGSKVGKLEEAKEILKSLGMPRQQQNDRSAYTFLSLAGIKENDDWADASINSLRIVDMMAFMSVHYGKEYKPNSRETIRKETIHQFCDGAIAIRNTDDEERATNSPLYSYRLTDEALEVIQTFGTGEWDEKLEDFSKNHETLIAKYSQIREMNMIPVNINGVELQFSPGKHNQLQKAIIEDFAPRFAPGAEVLYVGDTENKDLIKNRKKLDKLGVLITDHDKLPDVILYRKDNNWLYFIESVTSVGPVSKKRVLEMQAMLENCHCGIIYITAFLNMSSKDGFKKFAEELAWETEVWIADMPDHMIHLNGDRFLGPRNITVQKD